MMTFIGQFKFNLRSRSGHDLIGTRMIVMLHVKRLVLIRRAVWYLLLVFSTIVLSTVCLMVCLCSVHLLYDANFRTAVHARMEFNIPYHTIPYEALAAVLAQGHVSVVQRLLAACCISL